MQDIYKDGMTFKISSKRSDHNFELDSRELNQTLGGAVFEAIPNVQAQMKSPDINLQVEIREEAAYLSFRNYSLGLVVCQLELQVRDAHVVRRD